MPNTATQLRHLELDSDADQRVYRCRPPYLGLHHHVLISKAVICGKPETYIFACNEAGEIRNYSELTHSLKGEHSHEDMLARMGYVEDSEPSS